jgi:Sigma-70, region 4
VNRERAETHLRLVAEAELRRATTPPRNGAAAPPDMPGSGRGALVVRQRSAVAAALYDLPQRQREVIALQYYGNLSETETAATIGLTRGAVHSHTVHGISALQAALETGVSSRVAQVAQLLTAVRALDGAVAGQILDDFVLALGARRAGAAGQPGPDPRSLMRSSVAHLPLGMLMSPRPLAAAGRAATGAPTAAAAGVPGPAGTRTAPGGVIPLGQVVPVRGDDVSGKMHLLSYAQTASGARLTVITRARGEFVPPGIEHNGMYRPYAVFPVHQFTARDDNGASYQMGFSGRRGRRATELAGEITLDPGPPPGTRWLELTTTPGEPAVRIDLNPGNEPPGHAGVTVSQAGTSPGEHLLHHMAARLLLLALAFPHEIRLHPAVPAPAPFSCIADGIGDVIAALQACGALSPLSPVPGQLAALCATLNISGHGITARPARQLPGPWLSMLAHYRRRTPEQALARDGYAAAAVAFPELDGIRLALLGLHNVDGSTVVYGHASGMTPAGPRRPPGAELDFPLRIWVRDNGGRWHATRAAARGWNVEAEDDSDMTMRLEVVPPLSPATAWIEVLAAGQSVQARATLPLRWQQQPELPARPAAPAQPLSRPPPCSRPQLRGVLCPLRDPRPHASVPSGEPKGPASP